MVRKTVRKAQRKARNQDDASHGGARPGSGRKLKEFTKVRDEIVAAFERGCVEFLPRGLENLAALAAGVTVQKTKEDGTTDVYTRPPCLKSNAYLIDRVLGKPRQSIALTGAGGEPLFPPAMQQQFLLNPDAVTLACQLDEILAAAGPDPGGLRAAGGPGQVGPGAAPGVAEPEAG